jgi:hypothetical protein
MPFSPEGYGSGQRRSAAPRSAGPVGGAALALDNMLRNQLKVSDPRNPRQIAEGLLAFYKDLPQAAGIAQEAQGLPFLQMQTAPILPPPQPTSSDAEYNIAKSDVEKALQDLASNPLTNDITPEMQGWGDSIRLAVEQGHNAAHQGLDPSQRDKVMAVRRQLGEYGRMARFVGSLSPGMTQNFRRLGQAMDEMSAVLLVMLGESLASVGFASGYYLLQVPLAEVQQRRDAVIFALRNFMGGAQEAYGPDDWPRGIDAYRKVYNWLEDQGQGDLRSLLLENEIAQTMDALITRAQNGTPEGLRALGVTAQLDVERFRRMAIVAPGAMPRGPHGHPDRSPPLEAYLQALELFAETFKPAGGLRLLRIARPPILFYGIYNPNLLEDDRELVELIMVRGTFATASDGLFPTSGLRSVEPQVLFDMLLLVIDRGIDLLSLGDKPKIGGPTERRALAYWLIVNVIQNLLKGQYQDTLVKLDSFPRLLTNGQLIIDNPFSTWLPQQADAYSVNLTNAAGTSIGLYLAPALALQVYLVPEPTPGPVTPTIHGGLYTFNPASTSSASISGIPARNIQFPPATSPAEWGGSVNFILVSRVAIPGPIADHAAKDSSFGSDLTQISASFMSASTGLKALARAAEQYKGLNATKIPAYVTSDHIEAVAEELRVQESLEKRWQNLVRTVAPEAGERESVFKLLDLVVQQAAYDAEQLANITFLPREPRALPPQFEQSLERIARK